MKLLVANLLLLFSNISRASKYWFLFNKCKLYGLLDRDLVIIFFSSLTK